MAHTPDGTLLDILNEGKWEEEQNPEGALQGEEDGCGGTGKGHGRPPYNMRGCGGRGGLGVARGCSSTREYEPDPPRPSNVLEQLVAALCDADLEGNPQCR